VEVAPMRRSGTNPTAAAIGLLRLAHTDPATPGDALTEDVREAAASFLAGLQDSDGGLRANTQIFASDLLSTFTGAWTLSELGALDRVEAAPLREFALALECPEGGFHAFFADDRCDAEYTFYGLGVLGLGR